MVDPTPYLVAWRARRERQRLRDAALAREARLVAERLARHLAEVYGVRRVVLVGSLARGGFQEGSDIDLVVDGLADDQLFRAGAELEAEAGRFAVDLVPESSANALMRAAVAEEGIVLHARG